MVLFIHHNPDQWWCLCCCWCESQTSFFDTCTGVTKTWSSKINEVILISIVFFLRSFFHFFLIFSLIFYAVFRFRCLCHLWVRCLHKVSRLPGWRNCSRREKCSITLICCLTQTESHQLFNSLIFPRMKNLQEWKKSWRKNVLRSPLPFFLSSHLLFFTTNKNCCRKNYNCWNGWLTDSIKWFIYKRKSFNQDFCINPIENQQVMNNQANEQRQVKGVKCTNISIIFCI